MLTSDNLPVLNFPSYQFKVKRAAKGKQIFDPSRRKYVALTPEEWVRQHLISFLVQDRAFPLSLIATEHQLIINGMERRADIVAFNTKGKPAMVIECKAPEVKLSQTTLDQVAAYNSVLKADFLALSNGLEHYCCKLDPSTKRYDLLEGFPEFGQLTS